MTQDELEAFLAQPYIADLATVRSNGAPHVAPVWYLYEEGAFFITTRPHRAKVKHVQREPRVALSIHDPTPPYRGVVVEGRAEIVDANAPELTRRLAIRYLGLSDGSAYAEDLNRFERIVIKVVPTKIISWDYGKAE
jgi:PPOX class probable F420-dependent enzyme